MSLLKHELRQGRTAFLIWTGAIALLLVLCIFLFPEMKEEMGEIGQMFSNMGAFSAAFGMDRLNFGTFIGYYAIECGNVLGLGGAFFAALDESAVLVTGSPAHSAAGIYIFADSMLFKAFRCDHKDLFFSYLLFKSICCTWRIMSCSWKSARFASVCPPLCGKGP